MNLITRSQWRAKPPSRGANSIAARPLGTTIHWEGPKIGTFPHDACADKVRGIQVFHMNTRGWADIAYNYIVCPHGYVFEGRGLNVGSGANGTTQANYDWYAVCALTGEGDPTTPALLSGIADAVALCQTRAASKVNGHRDHFSTACPGPELYAAVQAGRFGKASSPASAIPSLPAAPKPAAKPAPKPAAKPSAKMPRFPGLTKRGSKGAAVKAVQQRLKDRGWKITVDGDFGPTTDSIIRQFQAEKKIGVDGIVGPATWAALWKAPVT